MWATKYGLLIERTTLSLSTTNLSFPQFSSFNFVPTVFALTNPLNEMSPFLILKQGKYNLCI